MHPALALAKRKLDDTRIEFDQVLAIEAEIIPSIAEKNSQAARIAKNSLRATSIEGVYTGVEGVLKEILTVIDGEVFAGSEGWHKSLLTQARAPNEPKGRGSIISEATFELLDKLRAFRHVEHNVYRHTLRETDVEENLELMKQAFPNVEAEVEEFFKDYGNDDRQDDTPGPKP